MDHQTRLKRLRFRAEHRGTREADMMIGGFFARFSASWGPDEADWFEAFLDEQDVDIMAWAMGTQSVPDRWEGPMMEAFRKLDFIRLP